MKIKIRRIFGRLAILYRPILNMLGVKSKTVASKAADVIEKADEIIPK